MDIEKVITSLWLADTLPIKDGLYRADGVTRSIRIEKTPGGGLTLMDAFSLADFLQADPEMVTSIDVTLRRSLFDHSGYLCGGEGSYGSEGFFARLDRRGGLVWVVYLEESNPIVDVIIDGAGAVFKSSSELAFEVNLTSREFGP